MMASENGGILVGRFLGAQDAEAAIAELREQGFVAERGDERGTGRGVGRTMERTGVAAESGSVAAESRQTRESQTAWFGRLREIFEEGASPEPLSANEATVVVHAGERERQARETIQRHHGNVRQVDAAAVSAQAAAEEARPEAEPGHIQLFGEVLKVQKHRVEHGEVRVRKESVTEMRTVEVPVTREQLVVERGRTASGGADEIRVPLNEEQVSVEKKTALLAEYRAGKRETTGTENVEGEVRREKLVVDDGQVRKDR